MILSRSVTFILIVLPFLYAVPFIYAQSLEQDDSIDNQNQNQYNDKGQFDFKLYRKVNMYKAAIRKNSEDQFKKRYYQLKLVKLYIRNGLGHEALALMHMISGDVKTTDDFLMLKLAAEFIAGNYDNVYRILDSTTISKDSRSQMWRGLLMSTDEYANPQQAVRLITNSLNLFKFWPNSFKAMVLMRLGSAYMKLGKYNAAISAISPSKNELGNMFDIDTTSLMESVYNARIKQIKIAANYMRKNYVAILNSNLLKDVKYDPTAVDYFRLFFLMSNKRIGKYKHKNKTFLELLVNAVEQGNEKVVTQYGYSDFIRNCNDTFIDNPFICIRGMEFFVSTSVGNYNVKDREALIESFESMMTKYINSKNSIGQQKPYRASVTLKGIYDYIIDIKYNYDYETVKGIAYAAIENLDAIHAVSSMIDIGESFIDKYIYLQDEADINKMRMNLVNWYLIEDDMQRAKYHIESFNATDNIYYDISRFLIALRGNNGLKPQDMLDMELVFQNQYLNKIMLRALFLHNNHSDIAANYDRYLPSTYAGDIISTHETLSMIIASIMSEISSNKEYVSEKDLLHIIQLYKANIDIGLVNNVKEYITARRGNVQ